ncbi:leucyl aminopeptidase family protein [Nocardioides sp. SYSU DS0663]|uniref:leucyl aminopeptidase family protein n=1 Tax=Nocardioides sp. SYSU DS0663 TaxID=3416445 RepID=UPI003F4B0549
MPRTGTDSILPSQPSPPRLALSGARPLAVAGAEVVALPVLPGEGDGASPILGPGAEEVTEQLGLDLLALLESERATGRAGEVLAWPVPLGAADQPALRLVLLVGVGEQRPTDFRRAGAALGRAVKGRASLATSVPALDPDTALEPFVVGLVLGSFVFSWRSTAPEGDRDHPLPVERAVLAALDPAAYDAGMRRALAVAGAGWRSRALATVPSNLKNPPWLAEQARQVAEECGLTYRVWDEQQLADEGFGGILAVGRASATPPRLVRLDYTPRKANRRTPTVALVGKGITFDTGGLSIKPAQAMTNMKRDMTGGAVVLATMAALAAVDCPVKVVGLVPMAENAVSGDSLRPGDVVRHWGGRTSEITNTDAEGRVVMADALAYAVAELAPAAVVDVATLTGAMKVALGQQVGGFFANREPLAAAISAAGEQSGELLWRMPLAAAYEEKLASKVADADNGAGGPGAITAALFLQHFVGDVPWAHLDVASVGDAPEGLDEWTAGPTGFGARALLAWLGGDPLAGLA